MILGNVIGRGAAHVGQLTAGPVLRFPTVPPAVTAGTQARRLGLTLRSNSTGNENEAQAVG